MTGPRFTLSDQHNWNGKTLAAVEGWDFATGQSFYILFSEDVTDGKNRLGADVSHIPLNTLLCGYCDRPLDGQRCHSCRVIHCDAQLTPCLGDPLPNDFNRRDAA